MNTVPILCLMGPTATGKTDIAIDLVKHFPFDIISVDSAMVYRGMDIGTAKPDAATSKVAPHRLIDLIEPNESYSAAQFCLDAQREIHAIHQAGRLPLLVGGTMLYFRALQEGLSSLPSADPIIRERLLMEAQKSGWLHCYTLQGFDGLCWSSFHNEKCTKGPGLSGLLLAASAASCWFVRALWSLTGQGTATDSCFAFDIGPYCTMKIEVTPKNYF